MRPGWYTWRRFSWNMTKVRVSHRRGQPARGEKQWGRVGQSTKNPKTRYTSKVMLKVEKKTKKPNQNQKTKTMKTNTKQRQWKLNTRWELETREKNVKTSRKILIVMAHRHLSFFIKCVTQIWLFKQIACFLIVYEVMGQGFKGGYLNPSFMAHMPHFMACGCWNAL